MNWRVLGSVALLSGACAATQADVPHATCFQAASRLHDVPADLLVAVARVESNFDVNARSSANAHGLMQIQWPGTARHLGVRTPAELYNPCRNVELGARYLRELLDRYGDETRALAAYNYGPTRIDASAGLPDGARRYATRVQQARGAAAPLQVTTAPAAVTFARRSRALRFADALNARLSGTRVSVWARGPDWQVGLPTGSAINSLDRSLLAAAGMTTRGHP